MVEVEPINREAHVGRELIVSLLLRHFAVDPLLQLWFAHDAVAVELVATADERVERLFGVFL